MKVISILVAAIFMASVADVAIAQQKKGGAFFCNEEFSGGLRYNNQLRKWEGAIFRATGKFVLRLRFLGTGAHKIMEGVDLAFEEYEGSITMAGEKFGRECHGVGEKRMRLYEKGNLRCTAGVFESLFNLETNRYLQIYIAGYLNGKDIEGDTPAVSGGVCTRID